MAVPSSRASRPTPGSRRSRACRSPSRGPATQRTWTARSASTCGSTISPTPHGSSTASTRPTSTAGSRATRSSSATGSTTPPTPTAARPCGSGRRSTSGGRSTPGTGRRRLVSSIPIRRSRRGFPASCGGWDGGMTCTCWRRPIRPTWRLRRRCAPSSVNARPTSPRLCPRRWALRVGRAQPRCSTRSTMQTRPRRSSGSPRLSSLTSTRPRRPRA